jgi:polar amino acid transport system substrate-binding protein
MKRVLSIILAVLCVASMAVAFTSCSDSSDWAKVEDKGYFVCGITEYAPMNYYEGEGDDKVLVGFDTEFAKAVAKELGVAVKFQIIDWPNKYTELNSGNIDLIWNGFTYGMESDGVSRTEYVDFTYSYLENRQCLVTKADRVNELNTADALKGKKGVAEGGSSGEGVAQDIAGNKDLITTFSSQRNALMELISGNADFAVIDYQMANSMVGKGDYASLAINKAVEPESEVYAIGCRKGSDLTEKINEAIKKLSEDGTLAKLAEKYGLTNDLIPNIGSDK